MVCVIWKYMKTPSKKCVVCKSTFYNLRFNLCGQRIRKYTKKKWKLARFCSFSCRNQIVKNRLGGTLKEVAYSGLHKWVNHHLGKFPSRCDNCGIKGKKNGRNWSIHYANKDRKYRRSKKDWIPLCIKCHRKYDKILTSID